MFLLFNFSIFSNLIPVMVPVHVSKTDRALTHELSNITFC